MKTVKVRIPVAVDPQGRWHAYGWDAGDGASGPKTHDELLELTDYDSIGPSEALFWVTAELAIPEVSEVEGEVQQA